MIGDVAFCAVLGLGALLGVFAVRHARPASRSYLWFAAILYVTLAIADEIAIFLPGLAQLAQTIALVVCALGPTALSLALFSTFEHPPKSWTAALLLMLALFAGIGAAASGLDVLSFALLSANVFAMLALSARRWRLDKRGPLYAALAALCLMGGAAAAISGGGAGRTGLALFSAAGLLGISLALARRLNAPVAEPRAKDLRFAAIGGNR